ncbi:MAG TPA: fused MFS/spermidine synthase [Pyrinomonadaceae bacterium]|nr:fused MFS/spermidine synthase [Pyrinomonadaceae bacterium]
MTSRSAPDNQLTLLPDYSANTLRLVAYCFVLSGATGLIYEVLWARMLGLVFGATTLAISTVLAAFMGGLALGSALAGKFASRITRPVRAYGLLEIGIALYALAVPLLFAFIDDIYALLWQRFHLSFFVFSLFRFLLSCLMLLLPTTLMGATLPLLSAAVVRSSAKSTSVTKLYTRNLTGAICGSLVAGFVLLPALGIRGTIYTASFINILIGVLTILADRKSVAVVARPEVEPVASSLTDNEHSVSIGRIPETKFWLFCALVSGFVTISTQVAWTRMLTMIIGSSTYAFSIAVALFLLGLSGGAFVVARLNASGKLRRLLATVELLTALSLLLSLFVVNQIPVLLINLGLRLNINSWGGLLALQILSVALLILLPAFLMGAVMPLVLVWAGKQSPAASVRLVGRSYAVNTIGAIAGAFGAGFLLIPKINTRFTIIFAAVLCVIVAGLAYRPAEGVKDPDVRRSFAVAATLVLIVSLFLLAPRLNLSNLSIGAYDSLVRVLAKSRGSVTEKSADPTVSEIHQLLMYREGPTSTVSVRKDWDITSMAINGRTNASDKDDMPTQVMLGQLPLLVAPGTKNGLVVGFASGVSVGSMLQSSIESIDCLELEPATVEGSRFFEHVNNHPLNDPRMRLIIDDARTYLRVSPKNYDMIVSEPSHPWVPGVANLFTEEFFVLGRNRLSHDGVFVQWLQIYQLSTDSLRSVLATFHRVFPYVLVFRVEGAAKGKDLILIGSSTKMTLDRLGERMGDARMAPELARVNIKSEADVRAWYVCDESKLGPAVAGAVINTDDNMHVETTVPREAFRPLMESNSAWVAALTK